MPYGDPDQQAKPNEARRTRVSKPKRKPSTSSTPSDNRTYLQKAAARRAEQTSEDNRANYGATTKQLKKIARGEEKRINTNPGKGKSSTFATRVVNNEKTHAEYRAKRIREGDFKGKYYGPDQFKGNTRMLARYRALGSPKITEQFMKNFKKWPTPQKNQD